MYAMTQSSSNAARSSHGGKSNIQFEKHCIHMLWSTTILVADGVRAGLAPWRPRRQTKDVSNNGMQQG